MNNDTPFGLEAVLVKSITSPVILTKLSSNSSVSSLYPLILIEILRRALPTFEASCVISCAAVNNAIFSSKEEPIVAIAAEDCCKPSIIWSLDVAAVLPILLIFDITPSKTSSASMPYAFITETRPVVAVSISIPGEILLNIEEYCAINLESFREYPNLDQSAAL